jgi:hypothetical protein
LPDAPPSDRRGSAANDRFDRRIAMRHIVLTAP